MTPFRSLPNVGPLLAGSRVRLTVLTVLTLLIALMPPMATAQSPARPAASDSSAGNRAANLPLFDAHIHYSHDAWDVVPTADVIALMRKAGLTSALVSSSNDDGTQKLLAAAPELIIPSLRPYRTRGEISSWVRDDAVLAHVEQRLKRYRYAAFGEFHLFGADADLPNVRRMMQLAVQNNLILHAHSDVDAVERLIRQFPTAKILWAHSGFDRPAAVAQMLRKHKNLWADLAYRSDMGSGGKVDADWAAVFKEFPDRFMVGTDTFTPERLHYIPEHATFSRAWLSALPREIAEQIAHRNGEKLVRPVWNANRDKHSSLNPSLGNSTADRCAVASNSIANPRVRVLFEPVPAPIRVGEEFSVRAQVCPVAGDAQVESFVVDATMPEHKHGMNYLPKVSLEGDRTYKAEGLVFHMPGNWQFVFDVRINGQTERLTQNVAVR